MRLSRSAVPTIAIIGAAQCTDQIYALAKETGFLCAKAGYAVVCGGLGGVMQGASEGASEAHGIAIGILPGSDPQQANPYISIVVPTGMSHARNALVVQTGLAVIAIAGGTGTLSEMALALKMGKPVISLHSWTPTPDVHVVHTPLAAVELADQSIRSCWEIPHG